MNNMPTEVEITKVMIEYLLDRRSALCREIASVERQLARLGNPVGNPRAKADHPNAVGAMGRDK